MTKVLELIKAFEQRGLELKLGVSINGGLLWELSLETRTHIVDYFENPPNGKHTTAFGRRFRARSTPVLSFRSCVCVCVSMCAQLAGFPQERQTHIRTLRTNRLRSEVGYEVTSIIMESEHRRAQQLASSLPLRVFGGTNLLGGLNRKPTGDVASRLFCWWPRFEDKTAPSAIEILARTQFDEAPLVNTGGYTNRHRSNGGLPAAMPI